MTIGEIIRDYRQEHKLSQRQFADKAGITNGYISMLENNKNPSTNKPIIPSIDKLAKIAKGMGISLHELLARADDMPVDISMMKLPVRPQTISTGHTVKRTTLKGIDGQDIGVIQEGPVTVIQTEVPRMRVRREHSLGATSLARNFLRNAGQKSAEDRKEPVHSPSVSSAALEIAVLFDKLDEYGKHAVRTVVNSELNRIQYFKNHHPEQENVPPHDQTTQKGSY